ncbi:MAG: GNAT family N-acetyltransferase [gamma proteobacterium endosymbiont of Lamellibrachia anaximandri]|nr:GNAT family N-acetyltransferase [gamma proteobacterium endosymbiont of Lamellibrachia anaximandri]MBL3619393.1 GNAT family N-acetyltransferase [gamma proteobacterium endosymbiont of Lamellibrachia anaximandri]
MESQIITRWSDFDQLKDDWGALLKNAWADTVFLTWDWIQAWREAVNEAVEPFVVVVRDDKGDLVGLAPFYMAELRLLNLVSFKTLRIMADYATGAEYPDWIVSRHVEKEAVQAIVSALLEAKGRWDTIWMPHMTGWTGNIENISSACQAGGLPHRYRATRFGYFDLPETMAQFEAHFFGDRLQELRDERSALLCREDLEIIRCTNKADLPGLLDALFELHDRRWSLAGGAGRKPYAAEFYRLFVQRVFDEGLLRLMAITDGGKIKAIQIGSIYNNHYLLLQEALNPDAAPGMGEVLRTLVIEDCINAGVKGYDFLMGADEEKRRWGAKERSGCDLFIGSPNLKARLLFSKEIWPTGRFLTQSG